MPSQSDVTRMVIQYQNIKNCLVRTSLSNITTSLVTIKPSSIINKIQPLATEDDLKKMEEEHDDINDNLNKDEANVLDSDQTAELVSLLQIYKDFSLSMTQT